MQFMSVSLMSTLQWKRSFETLNENTKKLKVETKKAKEVISLNQVLKHFTNYEVDLNAAPEEEEDPNEPIDDSEEIDIHRNTLQFFQDVFESMPRDKQGFAETKTVLDYIKATEFFKAIRNEHGRQKGVYSEIPAETVSEVLQRMENEAEPKQSWDDFVQYFNRRGRPYRAITTVTDTDGTSKILDNAAASRASRLEAEEAQKARLRNAYNEEDDEDEDINPTVSGASKYMRYARQDKDFILNQKSFKEALEMVEQEIEEEQDYVRVRAEEEERKKAEDLKKKVYGSKFGALYKESTDFKITEPKPFEFDSRTKNRNKTIRERKLEEMLLEKEQDELEVINVQFRANPVPAHVHQPRFEQIMHAQEERRAQVKAESVAITKARENPFSFYDRDTNKERVSEPPLNPEFNYQFRANPVPENVKVRDLWYQMQQQQDQERRQRIAERAEQNLQYVSLPPRMAQYEQERLEQESYKRYMEQAMPSEQKIFTANPIPDFERLQRQFQDSLEAKRREFKLTQPVPFNFQEGRRDTIRSEAERELRNAQRNLHRRDPIEAAQKIITRPVKHPVVLNKKTVAITELRREQREESEMRALMKEQEEQERVEKYHRLRERVQASPAIVDNAKAKEERDMQVREEVRRTMVENERRFEEEMRAMYERIDARPLLVEQETIKNQRIAQYAEDQMEEYAEGDHDLQTIDINNLTPAQRQQLIQQGYLQPEGYEEVAEEDGEEDQEDEEDDKRGGQNWQRQDEQQQEDQEGQDYPDEMEGEEEVVEEGDEEEEPLEDAEYIEGEYYEEDEEN